VGAVASAHEELAEEVRRFPSDRQVGERADTLHKATLALDQAERMLAAARTAEARARDERVQALNVRDARARQLELVADLDDLDGLDRRIDQYREAAISLGWAADKLRAARQRLAREVGERDRLREMVANNRVDAEERRAVWLRVHTEAEELAVSPDGLAATEALKRVDALRAELASLGKTIEARETRLRSASVVLGAAKQRVGGLDEKHRGSVERRESAAGDLICLIREGALAIGLDPEFDASGDWSMTRALEVARQRIEAQLGGEPITPQSMDNARTRLTDAFRELTATLAAYAPSLEWHLDGRMPSTTAVYNDRAVSIIELRERVAAERDEQEELFNKAEADLIERYLLGEVADHLRERVMSAEGQVTAINRMLRDHRTASGMYLSLRWSRNVENARHQDALQSLMTDPSLLREDQRTTLREFFQERIRGARDQSDNRTWREHLLEALDYRQWFRLSILKHQDGRTELFSDREFTVGSGGEKSVSLHLPLFAAAAAYYDSAARPAPRVVVLDEVFVGIDTRMRGSCLDMVRDFDLDLVMTSAEELGTYAEVPALGIYHMVRDHTVRGVLCEHWVWNGEDLVERPE
jgi:SbcC/RAD50-like, Walker B motif